MCALSIYIYICVCVTSISVVIYIYTNFRYDRTSNLWTAEAASLGTVSQFHFQKDPSYSTPPGSWARYDAIDFGSKTNANKSSSESLNTNGAGKLKVVVFAQPAFDGATIAFYLGSPDNITGQLLAKVEVIAQANSGNAGVSSISSNNNDTPGDGVAPAEPAPAPAHAPVKALPTGFSLFNGTVGDIAAPVGLKPVFMVFELPAAAPPTPVDHLPHRYWRLTAGPADFNNSFYNLMWHVCAMELRTAADGGGPNLATDRTHAIASSQAATNPASMAFDGIDNCTQWDGKMGAISNMWTPSGTEAVHVAPLSVPPDDTDCGTPAPPQYGWCRGTPSVSPLEVAAPVWNLC